MTSTRYTAVTFAPVQGFIEKSRKLRDLYGSSFILSFLAKTIYNYARAKEGVDVIVPALTSVTRGVPNNIYLAGTIDEIELRDLFHRAWKALVDTCRQYIEQEYQGYLGESSYRQLPWKREWNLWANYTWELFVICGEEHESFDDVRGRMSDRKQARDWVGVNWRGESSTLSGADAIAYPNMTTYHPVSSPNTDAEIKEFYQFLSKAMPDNSIDPSERLSIPELIKRLITYEAVRAQVDNYRDLDNYQYLASIERLGSFTEIDRWKEDSEEDSRWTGWFQGDGDRMGIYISDLVKGRTEGEERDSVLQSFSGDMLNWGERLQQRTNRILGNDLNGRIVYAGGDDFFGVLYRNAEDGVELTPTECLEKWWYGFNDLWNQCNHPLSVSTGFVWAAPNVPQRDLLQHLRETEKIAKGEGRDRLAIRILFNSGNYLDWSCPWAHLQKLLSCYRDRAGGENWTHIYTDIATLEARHAFRDDDSTIAQGIFDIYFQDFTISPEHWWNYYEPYPPELAANLTGERLCGGLLGNQPDHELERTKRRNQWIIALAKVGFHLFK